MKIVSDSGMDISAQQREGLEIFQVPLLIQLDGKTYRSGIDIQPTEFYELLLKAKGMPSTSLPSPGDFAELYQQLAQEDRDILSLHASSGLSSTYYSAQSGAELVPEANVTHIDTFTLSSAQGWQVEAAARAAKAGWSREAILGLLKRVQQVTETVFTLPDIKYLRHGGRISHIKGLLAQMLNIKPLIGVSKEDGRYYQRGQQRTFSRALNSIVDVIASDHTPGTHLRGQIAHANNPAGADKLREAIEKRFPVDWLPHCDIAPVLGAHTGPGLVGAIYAPLADYPALP